MRTLVFFKIPGQPFIHSIIHLCNHSFIQSFSHPDIYTIFQVYKYYLFPLHRQYFQSNRSFHIHICIIILYIISLYLFICSALLVGCNWRPTCFITLSPFSTSKRHHHIQLSLMYTFLHKTKMNKPILVN